MPPCYDFSSLLKYWHETDSGMLLISLRLLISFFASSIFVKIGNILAEICFTTPKNRKDACKKKLKQDAVFLAHNQRPGFHKGTFFALRDKQDGLVANKIPYITCQVFFLVIGSDGG